jgi:hypothetical protein
MLPAVDLNDYVTSEVFEVNTGDHAGIIVHDVLPCWLGEAIPPKQL